jgi:four helix bundle protein
MDNKEFEERLKARMMKFSVDVIRMIGKLPRGSITDVVGKQLMRCATSVGANYRAACRGKSRADFVAKLGIAVEEADESQYWLELLLALDHVDTLAGAELRNEASELTAILATSIKTAKLNR